MKMMSTSRPALASRLVLSLGLAFGAAAVQTPAHAASASTAPSTSAFQQMPDDPRAVVVRARGDGKADDSDALQAAIDGAANKGAGGIVFLP